MSEDRDLQDLKKKAMTVAKGEILNLCEGRSKRFMTALKCMAKGADSWSKLRNCIESAEGRTVSSSVLDNAIKSLEDLNLIKNYKFLDNIYGEAAKEL